MKHLASKCPSGFIGCQECVSEKEFAAKVLKTIDEIIDGPDAVDNGTWLLALKIKGLLE
jgi:hypothetical protein